MAKQSNIVSFDEARRNARRLQQQKSTAPRPGDTGSLRDSRLSSDSLAAIFATDEFDNPNLGIKTSDVYDEVLGEEVDPAAAESDDSKKKGLAAFFSKRKRERNKSKAERAFQKAYGSSDSLGLGSSSGASAAGPRAALYKGEMGSKQKRAARMQEASGVSGSGAGVSFSAPIGFRLPHLSRRLTVFLSACAALALFVGMLYTPTQQYYHQLRDRDRLNAEYQALVDRNITLQEIVDTLQTDEGVEDKAHAEFGYVKKGEYAGSVTGIDVVPSSKFQANIAPGSVPAPETWYSGVLDVLFAYND